jgi:hypothetical protein
LLVICLIFSISIYLYNIRFKHVYNGDKHKLSELSNSAQVQNVETKCDKDHTDTISDEDIQYLQDKGWNVHQVRNRKSSRHKRSLASIANCVWRVLNYPYMYNFYPILNFGVSKIMSGIGDLINNVHFPLFSSTTSQQPLTESELQAQELAYAQGQALSQEMTSTTSQDTGYNAGDTSYNKPTSQVKTPSQEYQDSKRDEEEEEEKEREEELKEKLRQQEMNKKIDEKAEVLAKKYVQMYFSKNKQQLLQDASLSSQNNLLSNNNLQDNNIELPSSLETDMPSHTTDLYDFNTVNNYALPNVNNLPTYN